MMLKLKKTNFIKKSPISANEIDINKIVVSNKLPFSGQDFQYFTVYKDSEKIRPICILPPQLIIQKKVLMKIDVFIS